jgi:hypothetical protein
MPKTWNFDGKLGEKFREHLKRKLNSAGKEKIKVQI